MKTFDPASFPYAPRFCEENIWHLARSLIEQGQEATDLQILFLSNETMQVVMAEQREAQPGRLILWDYHVVLLADIDDESVIFDFDTRLDFPCQSERYFEKSLPPAGLVPGRYLPSIRIIPAESYLERFYSDRSHMIGHLPEALFPEWPPIHPEKNSLAIAIDQYWDVHQELMDGSVVVCLQPG